MTTVLMAVPTHLAGPVAQLIADDDAGTRTPTPAAATAPTVFVNGWTEVDIRDHYRASSGRMREIIRYLALNADLEQGGKDIATALGDSDERAIPGTLGAAQRRAKNRYGQTLPPWRQWWSSEGKARFVMPADVAVIVLDEVERRTRAQGEDA